MGTYTQGLQRLDVRTGEIVAYKYDPKVRGSLSNNRVNALCVDHAGTLWVGTQNGLDRFDRNTGEFTTFGERDGLPNNAVEGILEDSAGNLWLSTGNGLSKFDPRARTFKNYFSEDGLAGDEFNDFSVYYKSASGEMFFGGVNGVTAFYPEKVVDSPFVPPVVLTDFRLFNDPVPVGGRSPLKKSISYTDSLTLSHEQSIFSLEFSALSYAVPPGTAIGDRLERIGARTGTKWTATAGWLPTRLCRREYTCCASSRIEQSRRCGMKQGLTLAIRDAAGLVGHVVVSRVCGSVSLAMLWAAVYQFRIRQLQRESKQLRDVIETIPAYVWSALPDGSVDFINRRWLEFSGFSRSRDWVGVGRKRFTLRTVASFVEGWRTAFSVRARRWKRKLACAGRTGSIAGC